MQFHKVQGLGSISATIIADSVSSRGDNVRITTFEITYPRFIHGELMTHRVFSRNAMSSRAVPVLRMIENSNDSPVHWGENQSGMQANESLQGAKLAHAKEVWDEASYSAKEYARSLHAGGLHKQVVNRVIEPFQTMKTIVTSTDMENFWHLRHHKDAQPEIQELAKVMRIAFDASNFEMLFDGEWHTPYVMHRDNGGTLEYFVVAEGSYDEIPLTLEEALKVSASCCAQVSFRLSDNSVEKAIKVYDRLVSSEPVHASPFEHQATPMVLPKGIGRPDWREDGVTHLTKDGQYCSGNFRQWVQHRQLIKNHVVND